MPQEPAPADPGRDEPRPGDAAVRWPGPGRATGLGAGHHPPGPDDQGRADGGGDRGGRRGHRVGGAGRRECGAVGHDGYDGAPAAIAAYAGRRGPGQPGSAGVFPGESASRAAAFGAGLALDVMPGCPNLAVLASTAAGPDDTYDGASDDELIGVLCAWDRLETHMAARKPAAVAELIRAAPASGKTTP